MFLSNRKFIISIYIDYKGVNVEKILDGVCIAVKDNINVKGFRTSAGTKSLQNYAPDHDAAAIKKLRDAGAIIIGMEDHLKRILYLNYKILKKYSKLIRLISACRKY